MYMLVGLNPDIAADGIVADEVLIVPLNICHTQKRQMLSGSFKIKK